MSPSEPVIAYVALGSNLGERERLIRASIGALSGVPGVRVVKVSSLRENPAVGGPPDSPPFLNAAAMIETTLAPRTLLDRMLDIERNLGRERRQRWAPRPIDLDLLLYGESVIDEPGLTVPHPLMHQRRFVLEPLAEVAPDAMHPVLREAVAQLLDRLK